MEQITKTVTLYVQESPYGLGPSVNTHDMSEYGYTPSCEREVEISFPIGPDLQQQIDARNAQADNLEALSEKVARDADRARREANRLETLFLKQR